MSHSGKKTQKNSIISTNLKKYILVCIWIEERLSDHFKMSEFHHLYSICTSLLNMFAVNTAAAYLMSPLV